MPAKSPPTSGTSAEKLIALGQQILAYRRALRISAVAAAEAAGMSRVTWHRIERGEPSVTMGAYMNALHAIGLDFGIVGAAEAVTQDREGWIPARIRIADYPQLRQLAWHVHGTDVLTPAEAFGIYDRNERHLDSGAMEPAERHLLAALRLAFGGGADV